WPGRDRGDRRRATGHREVPPALRQAGNEATPARAGCLMNARDPGNQQANPGDLRDRLLAQQAAPTDAARFARYRKEIAMSLEQTERRLRREKWITGTLWIYLVIVSVGLLLA